MARFMSGARSAPAACAGTLPGFAPRPPDYGLGSLGSPGLKRAPGGEGRGAHGGATLQRSAVAGATGARQGSTGRNTLLGSVSAARGSVAPRGGAAASVAAVQQTTPTKRRPRAEDVVAAGGGACSDAAAEAGAAEARCTDPEEPQELGSPAKRRRSPPKFATPGCDASLGAAPAALLFAAREADAGGCGDGGSGNGSSIGGRGALPAVPGRAPSRKTPTKKASALTDKAPRRRLVQQQLRLGPTPRLTPAAVRQAPALSAAAAVAGGGRDCPDLSSPAEVQTPAGAGHHGVGIGFATARMRAAQREEEVVDLRTPPSGERGDPVNPGTPGSASIVDLTQDDDD